MNQKELTTPVTNGETEQVEFKRTTGQLSEPVRTVCAMLNGMGSRSQICIDRLLPGQDNRAGNRLRSSTTQNERGLTVSTVLGQQTEQQPATRADLARQLLARVERLSSRLGEVSLAAEVQLLKRELARGHAVLTGRLKDNNFLSVVTLVEAALTSLTWKDYTPVVLDALRRAFAAGAGKGEFAYEHYDALLRHFKASGIQTGPTMDLAAAAAAAEDKDGPQA